VPKAKLRSEDNLFTRQSTCMCINKPRRYFGVICINHEGYYLSCWWGKVGVLGLLFDWDTATATVRTYINRLHWCAFRSGFIVLYVMRINCWAWFKCMLSIGCCRACSRMQKAFGTNANPKMGIWDPIGGWRARSQLYTWARKISSFVTWQWLRVGVHFRSMRSRHRRLQ